MAGKRAASPVFVSYIVQQSLKRKADIILKPTTKPQM